MIIFLNLVGCCIFMNCVFLHPSSSSSSRKLESRLQGFIFHSHPQYAILYFVGFFMIYHNRLIWSHIKCPQCLTNGPKKTTSSSIVFTLSSLQLYFSPNKQLVADSFMNLPRSSITPPLAHSLSSQICAGSIIPFSTVVTCYFFFFR